MNILVIGATGFLGTHITKHLIAAGHEVAVCVRNEDEGAKRFPECRVLRCDFIYDIKPEVWEPRIADFEVIINCVGLLEDKSYVIDSVHYKTPIALFAACQNLGKQLIHFSAFGADEGVPTAYAKTKLKAEQQLKQMDFNWTVFKPSLILSSGVSKGTALMRSAAALPFFLPVIGKGEQHFAPINIDDLKAAVEMTVGTEIAKQKIIDAVGPENLFYVELLKQFRNWLGLRAAKVIHIPICLVKLTAPLFGFFCREIPLRLTAITMLEYSKSASDANFESIFGFKPKTVRETMLLEPSQIEDKWHARLYYLQPILRISLAMMWILLGIIPLATYNREPISIFIHNIGDFKFFELEIFYFAALIQIFLGTMLLLSYKVLDILIAQLILIIFYTAALTYYANYLWTDPFGVLMKNIPILVSTVILMVIYEQE